MYEFRVVMGAILAQMETPGVVAVTLAIVRIFLTHAAFESCCSVAFPADFMIDRMLMSEQDS